MTREAMKLVLMASAKGEILVTRDERTRFEAALADEPAFLAEVEAERETTLRLLKLLM